MTRVDENIDFSWQVLDVLVEKIQGTENDDIAVLLLGYEELMTFAEFQSNAEQTDIVGHFNILRHMLQMSRCEYGMIWTYVGTSKNEVTCKENTCETD